MILWISVGVHVTLEQKKRKEEQGGGKEGKARKRKQTANQENGWKGNQENGIRL